MDAQSKEYKNRSFFYWLIILLAALVALSSIFMWSKLKESDSESLNRQLRDAATITVNPVANFIEQNIASLERMSKRWSIAGGLNKADWLADANNHYIDTHIYEALVYVDSTMQIKWVVPDEFRAKLENIDLSKLTGREEPLMLAKTTKQTVISNIVQFVIGAKGFLIIVPLHVGERFDGYIVGAVNVKKLFELIFKNGIGENYNLVIYQGTDLVYASTDNLVNSNFVQEKTLQLHNIEWRFYLWPTVYLYNTYFTYLPEAMLIFGFLISALMLIISYLYYQAILNANHALLARKEAENASLRLERILSTVNEGFISFDETGRILEWNAYAEKIIGWKKFEAIGKDIFTLVIPGRHRDEYKNLIKMVKVSGQDELISNEMEFKAIKRNGKEFPVQVILFPLFMDDYYTFHAFIRDISQRKKLEADQARYVSIINESDDAILSTDLNGIVRTWNKGAEKLFKYTESEAKGQHISLIHPAERSSEINKSIERLKQGEHVHNLDTIRIAKDGSIVPVSILAAPIQNKLGKITGMASISRDISDKKNVERLKNEFISIVSHELRTPLTSIRGSIALLAADKLGKLPDKAKDLLAIANQNCERLIRLINDVLELEKMEAGKMVFNMRTMDITDLISEVIIANESLAAKNDVKMHTVLPEHILIEGDPDRLTQVLTNLLSNAIRYSPPHGIIDVALVKFTDKIRVSVSDHGPGIPLTFQDKIFEKFSQADASDKRTKSGSGLGLSITKMIIERHHGRISFSTVEGIGTTFFFDLPLVEVKQPNKEKRHE